MKHVAAIILAAGKGTRMKSAVIKILHRAVGKPIIDYPVASATKAGAAPIVLVVGHQADSVRANFAGNSEISFAIQYEQLGTGHAVACAAEALQRFSGTILILCGDTPLLRHETLERIIEFHQANSATATVLTAMLDDPSGYGRIIRDCNGKILRIQEHKDATDEERKINEVNSGIYCIESDFLFKNIVHVGSENSQKEVYLTDILEMAVQQGKTCLALCCEDNTEIIGVNDRIQLAEVSRILRSRINHQLMLAGVTLINPEQSYIDEDVVIGADTLIQPNCQISGKTVIGSGCLIESGVSISGCRIGDNCHIKQGSVLEDSELSGSVSVGPMAHLRPGTVLQSNVKIGNFVETKKIVMGEGSKASHLTYLGDAEIGKDVNIGCGTITCNYDGVNKHRTVIGDGVFIGSDVQLVAPVKVGSNSLVAAGTTVTKDVPPDSMAIARVAQINKAGWRLKKVTNN